MCAACSLLTLLCFCDANSSHTFEAWWMQTAAVMPVWFICSHSGVLRRLVYCCLLCDVVMWHGGFKNSFWEKFSLYFIHRRVSVLSPCRRYGFSKQSKQDKVGVWLIPLLLWEFCSFLLLLLLVIFTSSVLSPSSRWMRRKARRPAALRRRRQGCRRCRRKKTCRQRRRWVFSVLLFAMQNWNDFILFFIILW